MRSGKSSSSSCCCTKIVWMFFLATLSFFRESSFVLGEEDVYMNSTGKSREELLSSGDYLPLSIFGRTKPSFKEAYTIEDYLPLAARRQEEESTNRGYVKWPRTFEENLKKMPKSASIGIRFRLYTLRSPPEGEVITEKNLTTLRISTWNTSADVKILIHGYKQKGSNKRMPQNQKDAYLLMNNPENIIILDWEWMAGEPIYFESAMYAQKVGRRLGEFLLTLKNRGLTPRYDNFHLIGYCLGAHVAGVAGKYVLDHSAGGARIRRITGLDPSGPGFNRARPEIRLDASDAQFVDVIHTNMGENFRIGQLGFAKSCGQVDFFPNSGVSQQTCDEVKNVGDLIAKCNHKKAADYFTRSIKSEVFRACKCSSWGVYANEGCPCGAGRFMGEYLSPDAVGSYYLRVFEFSLMEILEQMGEMPSD